MIHQTISQRDRQLLRMVRWMAIGVMITTPWYGFWSTWLGTSIGPLWLWKSLLDCVIAGLALLLLVWAMLRPRLALPLLRHPIALTMIGFATMSLVVTAVMHVPSQKLAAGLAFGLRYVLLFCIMFGTTRLLGLSTGWYRRVTRFALVTTLFLVITGILQVTVLPADFLTRFGYGPSTIAPVSIIDQNTSARRAFATMRGPNDFGAVMIIPLALACTALVTRRQRLVLAGLSAVGIFISGSRSAMIGGVVVVAVAVGLHYGKRVLSSRRAVGVMAAVAIVVAVVLASAVTIPAVRLIVFHSSPTDSHLTEGSTDKHWQQTALGLGRVVAAPLGCGLGCAGPASFYGPSARISENYYVQIAEETGVIGLVIWLAMVVIVMRALHRLCRYDDMARALFVAGLGIAVVGFWLHVWADITLSLVWWGLAGMVLGRARQTRYDT